MKYQWFVCTFDVAGILWGDCFNKLISIIFEEHVLTTAYYLLCNLLYILTHFLPKRLRLRDFYSNTVDEDHDPDY